MVPNKPRLRLETPATYRIRVQGDLDRKWSDYLQGMSVAAGRDENQHPVTVLTGQLIDQTALLGVLNGLYNYHLPLLSVECLSISPRALE